MAASCPDIRQYPFRNDDNVDEAGGPLVVVKFEDAVGIITNAEDNMYVLTPSVRFFFFLFPLFFPRFTLDRAIDTI